MVSKKDDPGIMFLGIIIRKCIKGVRERAKNTKWKIVRGPIHSDLHGTNHIHILVQGESLSKMKLTWMINFMI